MYIFQTLLAETRMAQIASQYRDESLETSGSAWILLVPVLAIAIAAAIYRWYGRKPAEVDTPEALVHDLCRVHGLPTAARKLLLKIGRAAELTQPATMFLGVDQFERAVKTAARRIRYEPLDQKHLAIIRRRAFNQSAST